MEVQEPQPYFPVRGPENPLKNALSPRRVTPQSPRGVALRKASSSQTRKDVGRLPTLQDQRRPRHGRQEATPHGDSHRLHRVRDGQGTKELREPGVSSRRDTGALEPKPRLLFDNKTSDGR